MTLPVRVTTEISDAKDSAETVRVEIAKEPPTLRDLIEAKVRTELAEWRARGRRVFGREYATELDLRAQAAPGQVQEFKNWKAPEVDDAKEVAKAIRAFEADKFHVWFADKRARKLDERVTADRVIRFVRQSPLPKL